MITDQVCWFNEWICIFYVYPFLIESPTTAQDDDTERHQKDQTEQSDCPEADKRE